MRRVLYSVVVIVVMILSLELFITADIETHSNQTTSKQPKIQIENEERVTDTYGTDITSFIESTKTHITNKEWMAYFHSQTKTEMKSDSKQPCNDQNWLNGLYTAQIYEPLHKWPFYENIPVIKQSQHKRHRNQTVILFMDKIRDINHENDYNISDLSTFAKWTDLGQSSLLIRRIFTVNDIALMGRFIEWLWAIHWIGHIRNDRRCTPANDHCRDTVLAQVSVESVVCWKCGCVLEKQSLDDRKWKAAIENSTFYAIARKTDTDKILSHHSYHKLYHRLLPPYFYTNEGTFLEIGLGCNMAYGPGHSAKIWIELFRNVEFIEYDRNCTDKYANVIDQSGYLVHVGSQENIVFLEELKEGQWSESGLDIVIDDGGHWNKQIISSFLQLWPALNDNGLYFIEDFQESAYILQYLDSKPIQSWGEELPGTAQYFIKKQLLSHLFCEVTLRSCFDLSYIECIKDLCVFKKNII